MQFRKIKCILYQCLLSNAKIPSDAGKCYMHMNIARRYENAISISIFDFVLISLDTSDLHYTVRHHHFLPMYKSK